MCVSIVCGLLEAILACLVISPSASPKGYIFVVTRRCNYTSPFVYIFLLIITSVALGISLWLKHLPWGANFPERMADRTDGEV